MSEVRKKNMTGSPPSDPDTVQERSNFLFATLHKNLLRHLKEACAFPLKGMLVLLFCYLLSKEIDNFPSAFELVIF